MIMAQKYYYLEPRLNDDFSILHECSNVTKTGSEGRWIPSDEIKTYTRMAVISKKWTYYPFLRDDKGKVISEAKFQSNHYDMNLIIDDSDLRQMLNSLNIRFNSGSIKDRIDKAVNLFDKNFKYLQFGANAKLCICEHKKGNYTVRVEKIVNQRKKITAEFTNDMIDPTTVPHFTNPDPKMDLSSPIKYAASDVGKVTIYLSLDASQTLLANPGDYDIGDDWIGDGTYCFYCPRYEDGSNTFWLNYDGTQSYPLITIKDHELRKNDHSHGGSSSSSSGKTNQYNGKLKYKNNASPVEADLKMSSKLAQGSVGEYIDGIATVPFIMLELRASDTSTVGFNLSLPTTDGKGMNSIISLSHERHMSDSYNTFSLQLFDKDALQVEAKLLLGFRYITFYYTDFVATSKRFKGMVLNYKTTITGKGLMLTLEGYTSNVNNYIGKDSIPWSILCEVNNTSFYYWMNEAKEYHGEVKVALNEETNKYIFNSTEGIFAPPIEYKDLNNQDVDYSLRVRDETKENGYSWVTYNQYYSNIAQEVREKYRPKVNLWSLSDYNGELEGQLAFKHNSEGFQLAERRPSDIVELICIINKWKYKNIVRTKSVSEIPDQLSMSYIEYIKEKLIPLSVSDENPASTNYYFWFDDEGYANYAPYNADTSNVKKLYFNSVYHKDSYPLIGFTSATNGSVLMVTDATNTMEAINAYTGDALSLSSVVGTINDETYLKLVHESSEWYSTNKLITDKDDSLSLISYSNISSIPSESDLRNKLVNRYGTVSRYSYKASLDVYGCADISPGDYIDIYIYIDDGARTDDPVSEEYVAGTKTEKQWVEDDERKMCVLQDVETEVKGYKGNITMHHTSGRYMVTKITDSVSAGKYISTLEVFKISEDKIMSNVIFSETEEGSSNKETTEDVYTESGLSNNNENSYAPVFTQPDRRALGGW